MKNEIGHNERQMQKINTFIPFFYAKTSQIEWIILNTKTFYWRNSVG